MNAIERAALAVAILLTVAAPATGQSTPGALGTAPYSYMHTLLQRTFLKVDVVTVDLCFDAATARRFGAIVARSRLTGAAADSITRAALEGERALARVEFVRDVSLDEFLDGIAEDQRKAVASNVLADSTFRAVSAVLPELYAFLRTRGVKKGDQILYELERESIRTVFIGRDGKVLLDASDQARSRRNSALATWLTRGSQFRAGLLESLRREGARAGTESRANRCRIGGVSR